MQKILFHSHYNFKRIITLTTKKTIFNGKASFNLQNNHSYLYHEEGSYFLDEKKQYFYQNFIYEWKNNKLYIYKINKQILHILNFNDFASFPFMATHQHFCKEDIYDLSFTVHTAKKHETFYNIKGPNKNYTIQTIYEPHTTYD